MNSKWKIRLAWGVIWAAAGLFMAAQVGFWDHVSGVELEDANTFKAWSDFISLNHALPIENTWQYPPGAAFLMLIPRIGGGDFGESFVITMLVFDLLGLILLATLAEREKRDLGVWVWLLAMPLLFTLPVLRFDLAPTVIAMAALVVIHRRPAWFGVLAALGGMVKVWPIVVLFGEWDRRRLIVAVGAALLTVVVVFGASAIAFGDRGGGGDALAASANGDRRDPERGSAFRDERDRLRARRHRLVAPGVGFSGRSHPCRALVVCAQPRDSRRPKRSGGGFGQPGLCFHHRAAAGGDESRPQSPVHDLAARPRGNSADELRHPTGPAGLGRGRRGDLDRRHLSVSGEFRDPQPGAVGGYDRRFDGHVLPRAPVSVHRE
jgi:hypothetical protein